jgi:LuxR family maltose regulon positive regulatory protein
MLQPQLVLKTTPPRLPRTAVLRRALARRWDDLQDRTAVLVSAPRGFGKTTLLAQWRRNWLERGAFVAWVTLDTQDTPARFAEAVLAAVRSASGRSSLNALQSELGTIQPGHEAEVLTALLAEIANFGTPTVIVLDDAERLPVPTLDESLSYLLYNAPPNLRLTIGSRTKLPLALTDLQASGDLADIDTDDLRLSLDDSVEILQRKFGERITLDECVRLHELTEGWPIGLQMAASTVERAPQLGTAIADLSARRGDLERFFLESMLAQLPGELAEFLVRCSMLESMTPDLCAAVTQSPEASAWLEQLMRDTPIVSVGEGQGWIRLHTLARDFLLGQFSKLPADERRALHARAAAWYAERKLLREAARHAYEGGDEVAAVRYAAECLRVMAQEGRLAEVREWSRRLPAASLERDLSLRLTTAWVMALGEAPEDALAAVKPVADDESADPQMRLEAGLIGAAAATFSDQPGLIVDSLARWPQLPPQVSPLHRLAYANSNALVELARGATEPLRRRLDEAARATAGAPFMQLPAAYSAVIAGVSYIWEGRPIRADEVLQPALEQAERESGRRGPIAAMFAGALAAVAFERDQPARARALLANRLDVVDRVGLPDAILLAYRTLSDLACSEGDERRALDALDGLRALGESRRMPRLVLLSLAEQTRIHAVRSRPETAAAQLAQIEALARSFARHELQLFAPYYEMKRAIATAYAAMAAFDDARAEQALQRAGHTARELNRGRESIIVLALQALVMHRNRKREARARLLEARDLASLHGFERLVRDLHPELVALLGDSETESDKPVAPRPAPVARPVTVVAGGLLTAKEAEVLQLLTNGLPNKLIARTMDISDETVKWHLKNLFSKLNAGSRKHAVDRARLLGLIA